MIARRLAPFALALLAGVQAAVAQGPAADTGSARNPRTADAVVAAAAPRSYVVVRVPVPAELATVTSISYSIDAAHAFTVVGRKSGSLGAPAGERAVLVTLGVPAHARSGRITGARVIFQAAGLQPVAVPVEILVSVVHRMQLATADSAEAVPGSRIELRYAVRNDGNTTDTVRVALQLPDDWRMPDGPHDSLVLEPGAEKLRTARISIPARSATGSYSVQFSASSRAGQTTGRAAVEVVNRVSRGAPLGPALETSVAAVTGGGAQPATVFGATLNGPLTSNVQVDGRFAVATSNDPIATHAFTRVNSFVTLPSLRLWSPDWRLEAGNTAAKFTELTGINAWGTALSASYALGRHELSGLVAPGLEAGGSATELYGARYRAKTGPLTWSSAVTRMRDNQIQNRELSAAGFGLGLAGLPIGSIGGEVAYREFAGATGLGWTADLRRDGEHNHYQFRYLHAPGGSAAFARAQDEISGTITQALTSRWTVSGSFFQATDSNAVLAGMSSRALAIGQQYTLKRGLTVNLDARSSSFSADAAQGGTSFDSREDRVVVGATVRRSRVGYSGELGLESVARGTQFDGLSSDITGLRGVWRGSAELVTAGGIYQLDGGYERALSAASFLPAQVSLTTRASQVRVSLPASDVFLNGEAVYQSWGAASNASVILRSGVAVPLPRSFEISAHAEYNTFFEHASARSPLVLSLKVSRGMNLPRLRLSSSSGYVFQDLNGNGERDLNEPGVGNVVVRQGDARATTTRDGRYEFWDRTRGTPSLETTSLPAGFVPAPRRAGSSRDIPLVPTSSVEIALSLNADNTRVVLPDLERLVVIARDQQGRDWIARRSGAELAIFDALPPGEYTLEFDSGALPEPLRTQEPQMFRVDGRSALQLRITLMGRPVRMFRTPQQKQNDDR